MSTSGVLHQAVFRKMFLFICFFLSYPYTTHAGESSFPSEESGLESYQNFIITGYYSPLPDQEDYITGSYEGDIKLNGKGLNGASGKAVFEGMLAAPKNYLFGTRIYFKDYGIGIVEDRGGAIVNASEDGHAHDRIDMWMGKGDEGRKRATFWGVKTVQGKLLPGDKSKPTLRFRSALEDSYVNLSLTPDSSSEEIKKFQLFFAEIGLYIGEIDGKYENIKDSVIMYQKKIGLIKTPDDWGAGYFGPKTIDMMKNDLGISLRKESLLSKKEQDSIKKLKNIIFKKIDQSYDPSQRKKAIDDLRVKIDGLTRKQISKRTQTQLQYFLDILH